MVTNLLKNIQNILKPTSNVYDPNYNYPVKALFVSRFDNGYIFNIDYKSLEYFVAGLITKDLGLMQTLMDGADIHKSNASKSFHVPFDEVTASQPDYNNAKGNVNIVAGNNEYTIKMAEKAAVPFNVTFAATIGSTQASGATIEIVGQSEKLTTNELGLVSTQLFSGTYDYVAKYRYCYDVVNSFSIYNSDVRVPINFTIWSRSKK